MNCCVRAGVVGSLSVLASCINLGVDCSKSDRTGTYLFEQREISGDCGPVPSSVGTLTNGDPVQESGCTVTFERWSEDECKLERNVDCVSQPDNQRITGAAVSEQGENDGELIAGTITMTLTRLDTGATICTSTYETTATRQ